MELVRPATEHLDRYCSALRRGFSPNTLDPHFGRVELAAIAEDPDRFLANQHTPDGGGDPIELPDGSRVPRLPGFRRWLWDGDLLASIGFRWQAGTPDLPPHVLGHIGYAVPEWQRNRGYATAALRLLLPEAAALGLPYVALTTFPDNVASQKVITANGGVLVERFTAPAVHGGEPMLRWRIDLNPKTHPAG